MIFKILIFFIAFTVINLFAHGVANATFKKEKLVWLATAVLSSALCLISLIGTGWINFS